MRFDARMLIGIMATLILMVAMIWGIRRAGKQLRAELKGGDPLEPLVDRDELALIVDQGLATPQDLARMRRSEVMMLASAARKLNGQD